MAGAIGKGDWVQCVVADPEVSLEAGRLYQVTEVEPYSPSSYVGCFHCGGPCDGILVDGVWLPWHYGYHCANRFRPIYRPNADLIESLKQPAPEAVRELVGL